MPSRGSKSIPTVALTLAGLERDIRLALAPSGPIDEARPCWKCGAREPAHYCKPEEQARNCLLGWTTPLSEEPPR